MTLEQIRDNIDHLIDGLRQLGYQFSAASESVDWPLEIRLTRAIAYAKSQAPKKKLKDPFAHPALAWVKDENITLPARFYPHPQARSFRTVDANATTAILAPDDVKSWYLICGSVDLRGRHPFLNPDGSLEALYIPPYSGQSRIPTFDEIRNALYWGGIPGLANVAVKPEREIEFLRSRLTL